MTQFTQKVLFVLLALAVSTFSACEAQWPGKLAKAPMVRCPEAGQGGVLFWDSVESLSVGQVRYLIPGLVQYPGAYEPLPSACLRDLELSVPEAGRFEKEPNGDYKLTILETAPLGKPIILSATYRGETLNGWFAVYDPEASPLVGTWRQNSGNCQNETIIRELIFSANGTFSVTWMPFEVYKDYWGVYTYDRQSKYLTLNVKSGNDIPTDVASGTINIENDALTLGTASFGTRRGQDEACRASFQ